jgi:putative MFS transporter
MGVPISARINRLPGTASLWKLVAQISMGGWFELYDLLFTGYIASGLTKSGLLISATQGTLEFNSVGAFIAATFAGLFVGSLFFGFLSDKFGRRFVFTYALLWYSISTAIMACQHSADGLLFWRFIAGIGVGVEFITIDCYLAELMPVRMRGRAFAFNQAMMFSAVPIVALLAWRLVPNAPFGIEGWRWVVLLGSAGAVLVWFIRRGIPESPLWLARQGRELEADRIVERYSRAGPPSSRPRTCGRSFARHRRRAI